VHTVCSSRVSSCLIVSMLMLMLLTTMMLMLLQTNATQIARPGQQTSSPSSMTSSPANDSDMMLELQMLREQVTAMFYVVMSVCVSGCVCVSCPFSLFECVCLYHFVCLYIWQRQDRFPQLLVDCLTAYSTGEQVLISRFSGLEPAGSLHSSLAAEAVIDMGARPHLSCVLPFASLTLVHGLLFIDPPQRDGRLSWPVPCWLTDSGQRNHIQFF